MIFIAVSICTLSFSIACYQVWRESREAEKLYRRFRKSITDKIGVDTK